MAVISPDHLLDQAEDLTNIVLAGAPRQANLRRAISNSYYALFHAVATFAADDLIGRRNRQNARYELAYRSVDHRALRSVCEDLNKNNLPAKYLRYEPRGGFGVDLQALAAAVVELQEKRHAADYDPMFRASRTDAVLAVRMSRNALLRFRGSNSSKRKIFLALVVFNIRR
jgi:hypothetical protein